MMLFLLAVVSVVMNDVVMAIYYETRERRGRGRESKHCILFD